MLRRKCGLKPLTVCVYIKYVGTLLSAPPVMAAAGVLQGCYGSQEASKQSYPITIAIYADDWTRVSDEQCS